jgi:CelD/BcsL family acetyltransferase involved in cellulose biosynthesis
MTIDVIDSVEGLEALRPEWWELFKCCPGATPFQSPQWLVPWTRHLYGGGEIWVLAIRKDGKLVGFAPLFCWGTSKRSVSFLGAGISDYGDFLFAPELENDCAAAVWSFVNSRQDRWDVLDLQELRRESRLLERSQAEECSVCPVLDLSTYPECMDHKHRTDVRRAQNKLRKQSDLQFSFADGSNFSGHLDEFFRLYGARWGAIDDSLFRFHNEVAAEFLAAGLLRLCLLRVDNVPAAAIYSFITGTTLYCYLSGYDPAMAKLSPGAVLLAWLIEQAAGEGIREVDFLRKPEAYKYLWGAKDRVNYKIAALR